MLLSVTDVLDEYGCWKIAREWSTMGSDFTRRATMTTERIKVKGNELIDKVKQLIREGNIRRVRIVHEDRTLLEIPLSIGAPAAAITIMAAPLLAALGAFAALVAECTIEVEKADDKDESRE